MPGGRQRRQDRRIRVSDSRPSLLGGKALHIAACSGGKKRERMDILLAASPSWQSHPSQNHRTFETAFGHCLPGRGSTCNQDVILLRVLLRPGRPIEGLKDVPPTQLRRALDSRLQTLWTRVCAWVHLFMHRFVKPGRVMRRQHRRMMLSWWTKRCSAAAFHGILGLKPAPPLPK